MVCNISLLPGVTAPGLAVICGAWLVNGGSGLMGGAIVVLSLCIWAYVHAESPPE